MCGRFTQCYTWAEVHAFLSVFAAPRNLRPRYNIAPTTLIDIVRLDAHGQREVVSMRWGLIPAWWSKSLRDAPTAYNARAETVATAPLFRDAFRKRRCLVPASGFYDRTGPKSDRTPHLFSAAAASPILALAGLWDCWRDPTSGEDILSCTIITTRASAWMTPYHDRMPVLIEQHDLELWLYGDNWDDMLAPAREDALREWPVSKRVNRTGYGDDDRAGNGRSLIMPITYHVVVPFGRDEDGNLVPLEPAEAPTADVARRRARAAADRHGGAVAFSRTGEPATGDFKRRRDPRHLWRGRSRLVGRVIQAAVSARAGDAVQMS